MNELEGGLGCESCDESLLRVYDREIIKWSDTGGLGAFSCKYISVTLSGVSVSNRSASWGCYELVEIAVVNGITK